MLALLACSASVWAQPPEPPPPGVGSNGAVSKAQFPDVGIIAPPPPTTQELAPDGLFQFIVHHGTTHYSQATGAVGGGLLRWRGGRAETVCPGTAGLDAGYNDFVSARVRAIAALVGAPVHEDDQKCTPNVQIIFTQEPRSVMAKVQQWGAQALRVRFDHQMTKALEISDEHAIQGWYVTAGGGSSVLNRDPGLIGGVELQALWPRVITTSAHANGGNRGIHRRLRRPRQLVRHSGSESMRSAAQHPGYRIPGVHLAGQAGRHNSGRSGFLEGALLQEYGNR
jgi:hypothetical protein